LIDFDRGRQLKLKKFLCFLYITRKEPVTGPRGSLPKRSAQLLEVPFPRPIAS